MQENAKSILRIRSRQQLTESYLTTNHQKRQTIVVATYLVTYYVGGVSISPTGQFEHQKRGLASASACGDRLKILGQGEEAKSVPSNLLLVLRARKYSNKVT